MVREKLKKIGGAMVELIGLCFYVAVLYTILVCYRFDFLKLPATLRTFADATLWGLIVLLLLSSPFFLFVTGYFSVEMGLKRG